MWLLIYETIKNSGRITIMDGMQGSHHEIDLKSNPCE